METGANKGGDECWENWKYFADWQCVFCLGILQILFIFSKTLFYLEVLVPDVESDEQDHQEMI